MIQVTVFRALLFGLLINK